MAMPSRGARIVLMNPETRCELFFAGRTRLKQLIAGASEFLRRENQMILGGQ